MDRITAGRRYVTLIASLATASLLMATRLSPAVAQTASDLKMAVSDLKHAWKDFSHCRRPSACTASFESFGVAITFADGTIAPFARVQRMTATAHDCIRNAKASLKQGDRSMAVQWAMASQIENPPERDWLGNHPDAVLEALHHCCS